MQINSTVQAPSAPGTYESSGSVENSGEIVQGSNDNNSVWETKNARKAKPGLFARLLDGLTGKTKKNPVNGNAGNDFSKDLINNAHELADSGKDSAKNAKLGSLSKKAFTGKAENSGNETENPEKAGLLGAGEGQNALFALNLMQKEVALSEELTFTTEEKGAWHLTAKQVVFEQNEKGDLKTADNQLFDLRAELEAEFRINQNLEQLLGENAQSSKQNHKNRAAVDNFPARMAENRSFQFTGEPKPGLVDTMGLERGAENREGRRADNRGKRTERLNIEVRDLRTGETRPVNVTEAVHSTNSANFRTERVDVEIPVDLSLNSAKDTGQAADRPSLSASAFEDALARELRDNLNTDIVRQASILLRNGGEGTIRLSLRPESLGNVKIRLEMTENKITGHIIVESAEALRAFERELPVLEKAFQDSGFSETDLDMFLAQDSGNYSRQQDGEFPQGFSRFSPDVAASRYESETDIREMPQGIVSDMSGRTSVNFLI